jgi:small subunit ribosomal protein S13
MKKKLYTLEKFGNNYGISRKKMYILSQNIGSNPKNRFFKLKRFQNSYVKKYFDLNFFSNFKASITKRLYFFWNIKLYRGIRHMLRLPARGQRTHTNKQTKKKFKF